MIEAFTFWRNKKSGDLYAVTKVGIINATNAQDGQKMVEYTRVEDATRKYYVREEQEFLLKFEPEQV